MFSRLTPSLTSMLRQAIPAAPPPVETTLMSSNFLARNVQRVLGCRADDDGGSVLVVVKNRDIHPFAAQLFDDKTIRGLDVFQVDRPEGWFKRANDIGQLFGVGLVDLDVKAVDSRRIS